MLSFWDKWPAKSPWQAVRLPNGNTLIAGDWSRYAREVNPDLVIMGAHGHGGIKDLIFGNTINPVRHQLAVPMLIVRPGKT